MKLVDLTEEEIFVLWECAEHYLENWQDPKNAQIYGDHCSCCGYAEEVFSSKPANEPVPESYYNCKYCPIGRVTKSNDCDNTPWGNVNSTRLNLTNPLRIRKFQNALEREYEFLVTLALNEVTEEDLEKFITFVEDETP